MPVGRRHPHVSTAPRAATSRRPQVAATHKMSLLTVLLGFLTLLTFVRRIWFHLPILFSAALLG